jgi:uridine phosphorylase
MIQPSPDPPMTLPTVPLLGHRLETPSALTPEDLMDAVRAQRGLPRDPVPALCVLDFDGDLTDDLVRDGAAVPVRSWACFHTQMYGLDVEGVTCGIVPRTIGGPYAVLIAEQLHAAGARVIVGLTSAGRVAPTLPLPSIVVVDEAIRDEGTSLHYLPASTSVGSPCPQICDRLARELEPLAPVRRGLVWTTDAPYRETAEQLRQWAAAGALAVEMQAASLFAFARARSARVGVVALVSNGPDHSGGQFDTGGNEYRRAVLAAIARAAGRAGSWSDQAVDS